MAQTTNNQTQSINSLIVDIIISCLKGSLIDQSTLQVKVDYSYLLAQTVRQYHIAPSNWHISEKAEKLWSSITTSPIYSYSYKEKLVCDKLNQSISISTYKGSTRRTGHELELVPSGKYEYNDIMVVEHLTPVSDVIKALHIIFNQYKNNPLLKQRITEILDKIHVARILRVEDRRITKSRKRISPEDIINKSSSDCYNQLNTQYYVPAKIILK